MGTDALPLRKVSCLLYTDFHQVSRVRIDSYKEELLQHLLFAEYVWVVVTLYHYFSVLAVSRHHAGAFIGCWHCFRWESFGLCWKPNCVSPCAPLSVSQPRRRSLTVSSIFTRRKLSFEEAEPLAMQLSWSRKQRGWEGSCSLCLSACMWSRC